MSTPVKSEVLHIHDSAIFDNVVLQDKSGLVLVDFYADRCGPCKILAPVMAELAKEHQDVTVVKVDVDNAPDLAGRYEVFSIPTVMMFKNGQEVEKLVGAMPKSEYENLFKAHR